MTFKNKYLKYKTKYLELKNKTGGAVTISKLNRDNGIDILSFSNLHEMHALLRNKQLWNEYVNSNTPLYLEVLHIDSLETLHILAKFPDNKFRIKTLKISINISDYKLMRILLKIRPDLLEIRPDSLTNIDLTGCSKITDNGLLHLSKVINLTNLNLSECYDITDAGLKHLSVLKKLTNLNLSLCDKITDEALIYVSNLINLTHLDLSRCELITDTGLVHLRNLTQLTNLNLLGLRLITDAGIKYLRNLPNLKNIERY